MNFEFEYHRDHFFFLPLLGVATAECGNPDCEASHWRIALGWFCWTLNFDFQS